MMVPACALVVLCLIALAVDGAVVRGAQRRLQAVCDSVVDDAAGTLDDRLLQTSGRVQLDAPEAERIARDLIGARPIGDAPAVVVALHASARPGTVDLGLRTAVDRLLLRSLPGGLGGTTVTAHCRGRLRP